jgi:putative DNA primase/helicase
MFFQALPIEARASESISVGGSKTLAYDAKGYRVPFNNTNSVEDILISRGYTTLDSERYAPHTATGSPSVRLIPGKDGLWHSDHASDPLHGTFDAWIAYVVLEHNGDLKAACDAQDAIQRQHTFGLMTALPHLKVQALSSEAGKQRTKLDMGSIESMVVQAGTEHAVAKAFAVRFDGRVKFDYQSGSWLTYTGTHWARQSTGLVSHYCREMAAAVARKCQRAGFIAGVERLAKTDPIIATDSTFFDHDNYLFNCPDGTYDLRDGTRREHMPSDQLANIAEVAPAAPGDYGERFPQFLNEVTQDDSEMSTFLQVSLGACLSGALENHHLMFWVGNGRNGKNTLGDLVMEVMGSYARKIPNNVLMKSKNERHPTEIADLKGARLVVASEIDQGAHWDEARINELTGDTRIKARFMHCNPFEFNRTFKILIFGNHRPRLQSATDAMRSRLKIVRFGASFIGREDPDLPAKLRAEKGNVLRWLMDGHQMWIEMGKKLPDFAAMREELEDYVDAQGAVKNWIDEALIIDLDGGSAWLKASEGYLRYKGWKEQRGEAAFSMTVWGDEMSKCFKKRRAKSGNFYSTRLVPYGEELKH